MALALGISLSGCGGGDGTPVVATYRSEQLTQKQLDFFIPDNARGEDSARFADHYIQQWLKEQAICDAALSSVENLEEQINYKVEDYRRKLIVQEYTSRIINDSLKAEVPMEEIEKFYRENQTKFVANENTYSYFYFSTSSENTAEPEQWMRSNAPEDLEKLSIWVRDNALEYKLDSNYTLEREVAEIQKGYFGDLKKSGIGKLIRWNTVILGQRRKYFFKLLGLTQAGEPKPLNMVADEIRGMLLNERKITLVEGVENRILKDARANNYIK